MTNHTIESSYKFCLELTRKHYENFPVASILIPKEKRKYISAIYVFARVADDIADESTLTNEKRIIKLIKYKDLFSSRMLDDEFPNLPAIYDTIEQNHLTEKYFIDLINAFIQDNQINRYKKFDDVLKYCSKSANPVGRILLELFQIRSEKANEYSDKICTALQLTNFYQDLSVDISKDRFYIPEEILSKFELTFDDLYEFNRTKDVNHNFRMMMKELVQTNYNLFTEGMDLLQHLNGLFKFEIKLTILGGMQVLKKIEKSGYNTFQFRPILNKFDWLKIISRILI